MLVVSVIYLLFSFKFTYRCSQFNKKLLAGMICRIANPTGLSLLWDRFVALSVNTDSRLSKHDEIALLNV